MMHDFDDDHSLPWEEQVAREYRLVVQAAGEEGVSRKDAVKTVIERLLPRVTEGNIRIPPDAAIRRAIERADGKDARLAADVLECAANGQMSLEMDGDPILDIVVTIDKRRKLWRWVTRRDLMQLDVQRYGNARRANEAYARWRPLYEQWLLVLDEYRYFGEACDEGHG